MAIETLNIKGIPTYIETVPGAYTASIGLVVGAGSINDPRGQEGIAHALEHYNFNGTRGFKDQSMFDESARMQGVDLDATTGAVDTRYIATGYDVRQMIRHIGEVVFWPTFPASAITNELSVIQKEVAISRDDDEEMHMTAQLFAAYGAPYGRSVAGYANSIAYTREQLVQFHRDFYGIGNMTLIATGAVTARDLESYVGEYFGNTTAAKPAEFIPTPTSTVGLTSGLVRNESENIRLAVHYPIGRNDKIYERFRADPYGYQVAANVLSQMFFDQLRSEGLAYEAYLAAYVDSGGRYLEAQAVCGVRDRKKVAARLDAILTSRPSDIPETQIAAAIGQKKSSVLRLLDSRVQRMGVYIDEVSEGRVPQDTEERQRQVMGLHSAQIRSAVQGLLAHCTEAPKFIHLTGPARQIGPVDKILQIDQFA